MDNYETPSQWARRMMDEAKTGEIAMMYFELMTMWAEREEKWGLNKASEENKDA